jgi:hypothetical protein
MVTPKGRERLLLFFAFGGFFVFERTSRGLPVREDQGTFEQFGRHKERAIRHSVINTMRSPGCRRKESVT